MSDWDDIPPRLCVDRFLPDQLHESAGRIAVTERPKLALTAQPEVLRSASLTDATRAFGVLAEVDEIFFQRLGLLREAKWEPGRTIAIGFYPGFPSGAESRIMAILEESSQVLNLAWRQVPVHRAEYRVACRPGHGLSSTIGTQCLMVQGEPTCELGDVNWSSLRDIYRCVRHEIVGHGTGAMHAQSLESYSDIVDLDLPAILDYYQRSQGWSYAQAKAQFDKVASARIEEGPQTRTSIMAYEVHPKFDRRGRGIPFNYDWDETDKVQFRRSYPFSSAPLPPPEPFPPIEQLDGVPVLQLGGMSVLQFPAGGMVRATFPAEAAGKLTVRVIEVASGSPILDAVPSGGQPVRVPPRPAPGGANFMTEFPFAVSAPGPIELRLQFRGVPPRHLVMSISEGWPS